MVVGSALAHARASRAHGPIVAHGPPCHAARSSSTLPPLLLPPLRPPSQLPLPRMREEGGPMRRLRRAIMWVGLAVCAMLLAVDVGTDWWSMMLTSSRGYRVTIAGGAVVIGRSSPLGYVNDFSVKRDPQLRH